MGLGVLRSLTHHRLMRLADNLDDHGERGREKARKRFERDRDRQRERERKKERERERERERESEPQGCEKTSRNIERELVFASRSAFL